jgi:hypothetical protein
MTVTENSQLSDLLYLVHDYWFNVEEVVLDPQSKTVVLRVEPRHSALAKGSTEGITLTLKNVESLTVHDTERVRDYDIDDIAFDPLTRTLVLRGGVPLEIIFRVSALEILVEGGQP